VLRVDVRADGDRLALACGLLGAHLREVFQAERLDGQAFGLELVDVLLSGVEFGVDPDEPLEVGAGRGDGGLGFQRSGLRHRGSRPSGSA
jgi:hypothetical protein